MKLSKTATAQIGIQAELVGLTIPRCSQPLSRKHIGALFKGHSAIRDVDGLHADEALDELCKLLFTKLWDETHNPTDPNLGFEGAADELAAGAVARLYGEASRSAFGSGACDFATLGVFAEPIRLSAPCLRRVISALSPVSLLSSSADLKGAAFQQVLSSATRAGMGQYFTPEPVVDCVVEILDPQPWERAVDPFCGSGRFLTVALQHMRTKASRGDCELHGIEKSDRMIRIALTDVLLRGLKSVYFHKGDALSVESLPGGLEPESFDVLLTNPPFGSILNNTEYLAEHFELARGREVVPLEVLGLELSLHLLKPGGRMAIVLPESVLNTRQMQDVRRFMTTQSEVTAVVSLPPQTFAPFDGVGKASVLFLRKGKAARSSTGVFFAAPRHVGYDNTGRVDALNDLPGVAAEFKRFCKEDYVADPEIAIIDDASRALENMSFAAARNRRSEKCGPTRPLGDLCVDLFCGRTPARSSYTNAGIRILKVRDLTGEGLDWTPGERSFVAPEFLGRGRKTCLQTGDIVLTAAAHHPKYIGQKVDIVDAIPDHYARDGVTCVAELLLIRVDPKLCDPYVLLLWLRSREGYESLQGCVVGQTAHLYATEVRNIRLPEAVFCPSQAVTQAVNLLKEALRLRAAFKMKHERATEVFSAAW